jgi:hypothetical protein
VTSATPAPGKAAVAREQGGGLAERSTKAVSAIDQTLKDVLVLGMATTGEWSYLKPNGQLATSTTWRRTRPAT